MKCNAHKKVYNYNNIYKETNKNLNKCIYSDKSIFEFKQALFYFNTWIKSIKILVMKNKIKIMLTVDIYHFKSRNSYNKKKQISNLISLVRCKI